MHQVLAERRAERDLDRLPQDVYPRIADRLKLLAQNPRPFGVEKLKGFKNAYRTRVGNYRILYEIEDSTKEIKVFRVKHRKDVYR